MTHVVPDLAKWQIRLRGVMVFGASTTPCNHPRGAFDDPMVPMPKDGAHRDGQILPFYVKWWNLTVPKCTRLRFWTHRIVHIDPRVLHVPFRCSETSTPPTRICHLARSGTIRVKMVPSLKHGELFSEMVLWPTPNGGSGALGCSTQPRPCTHLSPGPKTTSAREGAGGGTKRGRTICPGPQITALVEKTP